MTSENDQMMTCSQCGVPDAHYTQPFTCWVCRAAYREAEDPLLNPPMEVKR